MPKLVNRAKMTTATTGTGTITLGSAVDGYQTFAAAGVANGDVVRYVIEDGSNWEIGLGTYSTTGTTLTRGSIESSNADNPINLTGNAVVYVSAAAADLQELVDFADNFVLPTADGSTGQVLTTNGAGTLSFTTITGYTNSDVDAHLNTSTATTGEVLSWNGTDYDWIAAPAALIGQTDSVSPFETSLGNLAGNNNTGSDNTFVGRNAGINNTSGTQIVVVGSLAYTQATTSSGATAVGYAALNNNTSGTYNTGLGNAALFGSGASKLTGSYNVGLGYQTGYGLSTGSNNFLGGYRAGYDLTTGSNNVAIGNGALDAATTANSNVAIGEGVFGAFTTGSNSIALGNGAGSASSSGNNQIIIGAFANASSATVSNEITLGNSSITALRCQVTTITSLSDARDKTDIQPLNAGLEFVEALNPVSFTWNMRDGGKVGEADTGFIAQDLQKAQADTGVTIPGLVYDVNPDKLEAGYGKLIPVLVQAIKDLSAKVNLLEAQLEAQK